MNIYFRYSEYYISFNLDFLDLIKDLNNFDFHEICIELKFYYF